MFYRHPQFQFIYRRPWAVKKVWLRRKGFFIKLAHGCAAGVFIASIVMVNIMLLHSTSASGAFNAGDEIGQMDGSFNPSFNTGGVNFVPTDNLAQTVAPQGTALDGVHHRLFVSSGTNTGYARVLVYNLDSSNHLTGYGPSYVLGQSSFTSEDLAMDQATLCDGYGLDYDSTNNLLFVADECHSRVMIWDLTSGISNGMNATYELGGPDFSSHYSIASATQNNFGDLEGLVYDSNHKYLYVADDNFNRVLQFDLSAGITNGMNAAHVIGQANFTSSGFATTQSTLHTPTGLTYDKTHNHLFVGDFNNNRVMEFDVSGGVSNGMNAAHVLGQANFTSSGHGTTQSTLWVPQGMSYDTVHDRLFVNDSINSRVMVFNGASLADGMNASFVLGQPDFISNTCNKTQNGRCTGNFDMDGSTYDATNNILFMPDGQNSRVMIYDGSSLSNGMNATDTLGQYNGAGTSSFTTNFTNGRGYYAASYMNGPTGTALDTIHHRLFQADQSNNRVLVYQLDTNNDFIKHYADYVLGQPDYNTTALGTTQSVMHGPMGLTYDPNHDRLFVADETNNRVLAYELSGGLSNGMNASFVLGQANFTSSTPTTTQTGLSDPQHVAYDASANHLFVSDTGNNRIMVFDGNSLSNGMNASFVLGQTDFISSGTGSSSSQLDTPTAMTMDSANNRLFLFDSNNFRIQIFATGSLSNGAAASLTATNFSTYSLSYDPTKNWLYTGSSSGSVTAYDASDIAGQGLKSLFSIGSSGSISASTLGGWIKGLALDTVNAKVFVSDTSDNRMMVFKLPKFAPSLPDATNGAAYSTSPLTQLQASASVYLSGGRLPAGLSIDVTSGAITGTPTQSGAFNFSMTVIEGGIQLSQTYCLDVSDPGGACGPASDYPAYRASDVLGQPDLNGNINLGNPTDVAIDTVHHRLFVSDFEFFRISVYNLDNSNNLIDKNPDAVIGQPDFTNIGPHTGSINSATNLNTPVAMAYDPVGNRLFLADHYTGRVLVYDFSSGLSSGMGASHILGIPSFGAPNTCSGAGVNASCLSDATGVSYDTAHQRLFVSDYGDNRVLIYDLSAGVSDGMSASWVLGRPDFGNTTLSGNQGSVVFPVGNTYDPTTQRLFVGDLNFGRVMVFDLSAGITNGMDASWEIGNTDFNGTGGYITTPDRLAFDSINQRLFVADTAGKSGTVQEFDLGGGISNGMPITHTLGGPGSAYTAWASGGLAYDPTNTRLYSITGPAQIHIFDFSGGIVDDMSAADSLSGPTPQNMSQAQGTALNPVTHELFVADSNDSRVLIYNLDNNNNLIDHTPDYVLGQPDFNTADLNGATEGANSMSFPMGLTVDTVNDRLFVEDAGYERVLVYDLAGGISNNMNAAHVLGQPDFISGNCVTTQDGLGCFPYGGLAYDPSTHYLYVGDESNIRVMVFDTNPATITDGENASFVIGQTDFISNNSDITQSSLSAVTGMAIDTVHHRLFVGDWGAGLFGSDGRVMVFDTTSLANGMNATNELGETDFTSFGSQADNFDTPDDSSFGPSGLAYDSKHDMLFVEDGTNSRILEFDVSSISNGERAAGLIAQPYFTSKIHGSNYCVVTAESICAPNGFDDYYDTTNNRLYVSDSSQQFSSYSADRIVIYNFAKLAASAPNATLGAFYTFFSSDYSQGTPAYSLSSGSLPPGLILNSSTGLISGTPTTGGTYNFSLHLADDNNTSGIFSDDQSYSVTVSSDTTPPSVPGGLQVTGTTTTSISISWNASTDDVGIANYNVYRDGGITPIAVVGGTGFTDTGLNPSTTYTYRVSALDTSNNESAMSSPVQGTTASNPSGGGGNQGGNQGGNNQGGGNQGGNQNNQSSSPAAPGPGTPVDLDNQPGIDSTGYTTNAVDGQTFTFTDSNDSPHTITVGPIGPTSSGIGIDDSSQTVGSGQKISKDVNNDGKDDIDVTLNKIIDNNTVSLTFHKIIFAIAPGGSTGNNGVGGGGNLPPVKAGPGLLSSLLHHIPKVVLLVFPWLLFVLLGLSVLRLIYLSFQERRFAGKLNEQLAREKALDDQRNNFIKLASHYLRTPVTTISTGLELATSMSGDSPAKEQLKDLSSLLSVRTNELLAQVEHRAPSEVSQPTAGMVVPGRIGAPALASGFIQLDSLRTITIALLSAVGLIGLTDYILVHVDLYNVRLVHMLTQLAGMVLLFVVMIASLRSYRKRRQLRLQAEKLLANQRELAAGRNTLIKNSLAGLRQPLKDIRARLQTVQPTNPQVIKPALDGLAQLEALLQKFLIATSLDGGTIGQQSQPVDLNRQVGTAISRYTNAVQNKYLAIKNEAQPVIFNQDPLLLSFVIDSLLNNAIKYSPPNNEITIDGGRKGGAVEVSVTDHGIGIPQERQAGLFEAFSRVEDAAQDFNIQGAGLSLYLDRLIMECLGGQISLNSKPGQGTTVTFSLPAAT